MKRKDAIKNAIKISKAVKELNIEIFKATTSGHKIYLIDREKEKITAQLIGWELKTDKSIFYIIKYIENGIVVQKKIRPEELIKIYKLSIFYQD